MNSTPVRKMTLHERLAVNGLVVGFVYLAPAASSAADASDTGDDWFPQVALALAGVVPTYAQTQGMDRRDDRRDDRAGARADKQACKAGDEKSRPECRQMKRDSKQDARQGGDGGQTNEAPAAAPAE